jgi:hypothetical protein
MKNIFTKMIAKTSVKEELQKVFVTKEKLVATNGYALIEVDHKCFHGTESSKLDLLKSRFTEKTLLKPEELDFEDKILDTMPIDDEVNYIDYKQVIPPDRFIDENYLTIQVNPKYLADLAHSIAKTFTEKGYMTVELCVPKRVSNYGDAIKGKPVILRRKGDLAVGVIMPVNEI